MKFMKMEKCFYRAMTKIDLETLKSIEKLVKIGVRNDSGEKMMLNFSKMDRVKKDGQLIMLYLKTEGENYNLKAIDNIPEYLEDDDFKYPYIRKIIYAIGAQPQPEILLALEKLASDTNDTEIKKLALHQLEKRKEMGR